MLSVRSLSPEFRNNHRRRGRGRGSSKGKTSGRGHKGQTSRAGSNHKHEGGQTPIHRQLPKYGFPPKHKNMKSINLTNLELSQSCKIYSIKNLKHIMRIKQSNYIKLLTTKTNPNTTTIHSNFTSNNTLLQTVNLGNHISLIDVATCQF